MEGSKVRGCLQELGIGLFLLISTGVVIGIEAVPVVFDCSWNFERSKTKGDIMAISCALDEFAIQNGGHYPESLDDLLLLNSENQPYLAFKMPMDKWGVPYRYDNTGDRGPWPCVYTLGRDGVPGGTGEDEDISNLTLLGFWEDP